jgi:integrator complex subunit 2
LNELISVTLDFSFRIDPGSFHHSRLLLVQRVFTNDQLVQRFATIKTTPNLNGTMTIKQVPAHFISYLLSKGLCNQHHVQMSTWVWQQMKQCTTPIHPIMLTLINELVRTIVDSHYSWHLMPIDTKLIHEYLQLTNESIPTKMLIILYLLTLNDQSIGAMNNRYEPSIRQIIDCLPLPHLVGHLTNKGYDAIAPQLGR